ncbi:response regulator transcription factor [Actinoplanes awajinensis]|uniref:Two-component system response regulator n=1 Tax=Actinoplanes awajinensis subsp. mycoplanecinus TaxID=135947 RepID=A0A101JRM2_9ACTN|nr:response regulator transcription factor [Actinoplanes awajinensis]KUL31711.1 two-component system response regulator [Actinoplanes awajinensis subsp. mycoplanecinus]
MIAGRRVLVVDDHPVVRRGLRAMLESESWVATVTEAATVAEAVRAATVGPVHLIAMDVGLPDGDGIDAAGRILRAAPGTRVLILTMDDDESVVDRALRAGAHGFLLKDTDPELVVDSLRTVAGGGVVLGPRTAGALLTGMRAAPARVPAPFDRLSEREREVVTRLTAGESNAQIARRLGLSEKTVRNQLSLIFSKLGVTDRLRVALLARDAGLR